MTLYDVIMIMQICCVQQKLEAGIDFNIYDASNIVRSSLVLVHVRVCVHVHECITMHIKA